MEHPEVKQKRLPMKPLLAAVCILAAILLDLFAVQYQQAHAVRSILTLDVNPSVELRLNQKARVVEAVAVNDDGAAVLEGMDLQGTDLNVAVNALMGAMLRHGYVDQETDTVLISVADTDGVRGAALRLAAEEEASSILDAASVPATVLTQSVPRNAALEEKAEQYGISIGKAQLIETMVAGSDHWTFETLAGLTIGELHLLGSGPTAVQDPASAPGQSAYIGIDAAKAAAFAYAGVAADQAVVEKVEYDYENGMMVYEVEFLAAGMEYDCEVNAVTGEVVTCKTEPESQRAPGNTQPSVPQDNGTSTAPAPDVPVQEPSQQTTDIGTEQAESIALGDAGMTEGQVLDLRTKSEWDDGILAYHVEFCTGETTYEYEIHACTGTILKLEREYCDHAAHRGSHHPDKHHSSAGSTTSVTAPAASYIGIEAAQTSAYRHAGVDASTVYDLSVEEKLNKQPAYYEIDFKSGGMEYEYEIDAQTGAVLNYENDWDD